MQEDFEPIDEVSQWDKPLPFPMVEIPSFPVDSLPTPMRDFVVALAESTQTPPEMAGILSLGVLSAALQRKYVVQVTPDWIEPLCLYAIAVAPPAERKSAVINSLISPIQDYEAEQQEKMASEIARNREQRDIMEKEKKAAETEAIRGGENASAAHERALDLAAKLEDRKSVV